MIDILISVAAKAAEYLVDPIKRQLSYPFTYHRNVQDLLQKIDGLVYRRRVVEELVRDANRQGNEIFLHVQEWLQATEGILQTREDFVQGEGRASQQSCFHIKSRYHLSRRARTQGKDIDAKLQQACGFGRDTVSYCPSPPLIRSASSTNDAVFPSRESIFNQIMDALRNEQTSIVGVWGLGGVGKTTLALQVGKRAEEEKLFDKVVMASTISQTPNIPEIQTELARTLGLRFEEGKDRSVALMNSLKKQKKILVILDDIWDELDLTKIGIPYGEDHKGCKLLLTSREKDVVATDMGAEQVFHLPHLVADEAWSLFKRTAGDSMESPEWKTIADEIVRKCEGLPLAIITIAKALKNKSLREWKNAMKELKMAKPENVRGMSKNVYSCLELSYNHLEGDEVKSLLLLCGLVGGRPISKDHLLLNAKGLNMFEGMYSMEDATNKLITLVQRLIDSSLLLEAEEEDDYHRDRSLFFDGSLVKMHDVVRDVARSIASKDVRRQYHVVSEAAELGEWKRTRECRNYTGISLECQDQDELPSRITAVCPELELLLLNSSLHELRIPEDFFQGVTKLRVLHMSRVSLGPSPPSLGYLSNLRTLCLIECQLEDMKIIGELKGLQVLSLAHSWIGELPKEIEQLKDLRVLDLQYCHGLIIPRNVISNLSGLECLSLRGCDSIEWGRDRESNNNRACLSEIKDLPRLRTLEVQVWDPSLLREDIGLYLVNLTRYVIRIGYGARPGPWRHPWIRDEDKTHMLNKFPRNLMAKSVKSPVLKSFSNLFKTCQLVYLEDLDGISNVVYDLAKENGFPQLERLTIEHCHTIRHIVSSQKWVPPRDTFCRLDRLDLAQLCDLESVFNFHENAPIHIECFGKLRSLSLKNCENLKCVMSLPMQDGRELNFFPRLQKLQLDDLDAINSFYSIASSDQHSQEYSMSIFFNEQAAFPALEDLYVSSMGPHQRALWHNQFPADSFSKLKKLEVKACGGLRKVFSVSLVKALVQLEKLTIFCCSSLEEIVANEGEEVEDEEAFFPKLTYLELKFLLKLKRFCSRGIKLRWPLLKDLSMLGCNDQVGILFQEIGLEGQVNAPSLFSIDKEAFPDLETLHISLLNVNTLDISLLNGVVDIWRGQFSKASFSKLRVLIIQGCHGISFVISITMIQNLHNLEVLKVGLCALVKEVIHLHDGEPAIDEIDFNKLKTLELDRLPNLKGFCSATSTFKFPSLEYLHLLKCPKMEFFCKGDFHVNNDLKEYILGVLHSNTQAIHETSTGTNSSYAGTDMMATEFHLPHLEAEEAWSLFKRTTGGSMEYSPQLKAIADEIVKRCEGFPLAIITIANALKDKSVGEWKNALKELEMAKPTNIIGMSENVYSCLELCYNHLEGDELKSLFLLCGLLGGGLISLDHLLLYAMGLNMFEGMYSLEDATNKLIMLVGKLIASGLLLNVEEGGNDTQRSLFFDDLFVKMEDVVRNVARSIASKDGGRQYVVSAAVELREWERRGERRNYSGISLECEDTEDLPPRLVCPELELFLLMNPDANGSLWWRGTPRRLFPEDFFQEVTKLRVLHMSGVSLRPFPSSLGFLSNLRTLCLIECQVRDMKIIGQIKTFQVLSLAKSTIKELPKEIAELKDLRVLDLQDCGTLRVIPRNVISSLSRLECLNLRGCDKIEWGRDGESNNNKACLSEIKDLPRLRIFEVDVSNPSLLPTEDIGLDVINLTRYSIKIGDVSLYLPKNFPRNLRATGVVSLKCFSNLFKTCQAVTLEKLDGISNVVYDFAKENAFPQLECVKIEYCDTIRHIFSSSGWVPPCDSFCRLDQLDLFELSDLESVFDFHESSPIFIQCFVKLRILRLNGCKKLRCVMSLPMQNDRELNFFPRLQKLKLGHLPDLISFYSTATPLQVQESMSIFFNQQVTFPALEKLHVVELGHLQALWHNQANSFSKLKKLKVRLCSGLQKVFSVSLVKALIQLEELKIDSCELLEEIIARGEDVEDEVAFFLKLTHLKLELLPLLKRFCSQGIKLRCPLLKDLNVQKCDDQVRVLFGLEAEVDAPVPFFLVEKEAFPDLETLDISLLNGVVEIWRGQFSRASFSKLRVLNIEGCHGISFVISITMIQNLHNLEELKVGHCDSVKEVIQQLDDEPTIDEIDFRKLKSLHLSILPNLKGFCSATCTFKFSSLEDLQVQECDDQVGILFGLEGEVDAPIPFFLVEKEAFPDLETLNITLLKGVVEIWRGQFSRASFSKLRVLSIWGCDGISFVISITMIQNLHNLEELTVGHCDSVKEVIRQLDDEPTIDDIDFSRLKSLYLSTLPNWKGFCSATCTFKFPSLEDLHLSNCPKMEFFCKGDLHFSNDTLKEYILGFLHSNTGSSGESDIASN